MTGNNEINDLFFKKIDEIDELIVNGKNLDFIQNRLSLEVPTTAKFSELDINKKSKKVSDFPNSLIKNIFNINETQPTILLEEGDKFLIIELTKTENIQKKISDKLVKGEILLNLEKKTKKEIISEIINKINKNNFKKIDFDKLSKDESVPIEKIIIKNKNDNKILKQNLIDQIYAFAEKKVIVVADVDLIENYLIYIDKVENVSIEKNSDDYKKYFEISKFKMANNLYNTYDFYLKNKYEININYKALDSIKNNY